MAELEARAASERKRLEQEQEKIKHSKVSQRSVKESAKTKASVGKETGEKTTSGCNFWCRITGGNNEKTNNKTEIKKGPTQVTTQTVPKIGDVVSSGNFSYRVNSIKCGETVISWVYGSLIRYKSTAQGKFCRLNLSVKNIGDYEDSISVSDQYLYNSRGQRWSYDGSATSNAAKYLYGNPLNASINPGNSITADIVYDIPAGQSPTLAEVDGGLFAGAKKISLR